MGQADGEPHTAIRAAAMAELPEPIVRALAEFPVVTPFARVTLHEAQRHDDRVRARVLVELLAELEVVDVFVPPAGLSGVRERGRERRQRICGRRCHRQKWTSDWSACSN